MKKISPELFKKLVELEPDLDFESSYDLQSEINAHAAGFNDLKDKMVFLLQHCFEKGESGNCRICGQDVRHIIHTSHNQ